MVQVLAQLDERLAALGCSKRDLHGVRVALREPRRDSASFVAAWVEWAAHMQPVHFRYVPASWKNPRLLVCLEAWATRPPHAQ